MLQTKSCARVNSLDRGRVATFGDVDGIGVSQRVWADFCKLRGAGLGLRV